MWLGLMELSEKKVSSKGVNEMKIKVTEVRNLDNDLTVVFKDYFEMGRDAALKAWGD